MGDFIRRDYDPMSGEVGTALSMLRSRLNKSREFNAWRERWETLLAENDREEFTKGQRAKVRRKAMIDAAQFYKIPYAKMEPEELPLWGYQPPRKKHHASAEAHVEAASVMLSGDPEAIAEALHNNPLFESIKDMAREEQWLRNLVLEVPVERSADAKTMVSWVINYLMISLEHVTEEMVPSRAALAFLDECRQDADFRREFLKKWMDKFLPSKQQVEYEQMYADDGRRNLEMVEKCLLAVNQEEREDGEA